MNEQTTGAELPSDAAAATNRDRVAPILEAPTTTTTPAMAAATEPIPPSPLCPFYLTQRVRKRRGAEWQGRVVGWYSTTLTPVGYVVESEREKGSVQLYPAAALEAVEERECEREWRGPAADPAAGPET